ncbi:MAG: hypothetical protein JWM43_1179 [Acidobacteriaceae bacterium]|nr:hypothetical protein [Acidobacteriaceae bacterium]
MKFPIVSAALVLAAVPAFSHAQLTGVSNPDPVAITATPDEDATPKRVPMKPAAGTPAAAPAVSASGSGETYGTYVPYRAAGSPVSATKSADNPDSDIVTSVDRTPEAPASDAGIVTSVTERDGEIREGTLLRVRIRKELSTTTTVEGSPFTAELTEAVEKNGRVILPVGAVLEGNVTRVRSGKRISGAAMMHLEPRSVTLPDGTLYLLHAQLIDTSSDNNTRVGSEGNLIRRDHAKETLAVVGGVTGAGAIAGGLIGGGIGAAVGAGIGAGAGTIVWLKQDRQATLPQDSLLVFSLTTPMEIRPLRASNGGGQ